jgi:hypothetical protein
MDETTKTLYSFIEKRDATNFKKYISSEILPKKIIIDDCCFYNLVVICNSDDELKIIEKIVSNNLVQNLEQCFEIFFSKFATWDDNVKKKLIFNIYVNFDTKLNIENISHFNKSIKYGNTLICDYLMNKYKFKFTSLHYKFLAEYNKENIMDLIMKYIPNLTLEHLRIACEVQNINLVKYCLLDMKIKPDNECYNSTILGIPNAKQNNSAEIIELLVAYGYALTYYDILFATEKKITLRDNFFTKNFVPKEDFFDLCNFEFHPEYNQNMYRNNLWLYRLCSISHTSNDDATIKREMKKYGLKFDAMCFHILNGYQYIEDKNKNNFHYKRYYTQNRKKLLDAYKPLYLEEQEDNEKDDKDKKKVKKMTEKLCKKNNDGKNDSDSDSDTDSDSDNK